MSQQPQQPALRSRTLPAQRLAELRRLISTSDGQVFDLGVLAERFGVSSQTIRRDMEILAEEGLVERTFGGAVAQSSAMLLEPALSARSQEDSAEKDAIARAALALLKPGETVYFDASTTVHRLLELLPAQWEVNATTSSLRGIQVISRNTRGASVLLGGDYRPSADCVGGVETVEQVSRMRFSTAVISCRALSLTHGVTEARAEEAALKRAVLSNSGRTLLLAASSKLEQVAGYHVADLQQFDALITDSGADAAIITRLREHVPTVMVAEDH